MQFAVSMPITMHVSILVEADDEEKAKAAAFEADFGFDVVGPSKDKVEIIEWEMHSHVTRGNVYSGVINDIDVEEVD